MSDAVVPAAVSVAAPVVVRLKRPVTTTSPKDVTATPLAASPPVPPSRIDHDGLNGVAAAGSTFATNASEPPALASEVAPKDRLPVKVPATISLPDESTAMLFGV